MKDFDIFGDIEKMQENVIKLQEEFEKKKFKSVVGNGAVTVVVNGKKQILLIDIVDKILNKSDKLLIEELITQAINEAMDKIDLELKVNMKKMGSVVNLFSGKS